MAAPGQGSFYPVTVPPPPGQGSFYPVGPDAGGGFGVPPSHPLPTGSVGDTGGTGGAGGTGGTGGTSINWDQFYNQLANDPMYKQALAFINASRATDKAQLTSNEARAQEKYTEAARRIGVSKEDSLRMVMNELAARHALESGDTAFYRGKVEEQAKNAVFDAHMSLQDYIAGVEAAYQQSEFNRMMQQYGALVTARDFQTNIWETLGGLPSTGGGT